MTRVKQLGNLRWRTSRFRLDTSLYGEFQLGQVLKFPFSPV